MPITYLLGTTANSSSGVYLQQIYTCVARSASDCSRMVAPPPLEALRGRGDVDNDNDEGDEAVDAAATLESPPERAAAAESRGEAFGGAPFTISPN